MVLHHTVDSAEEHGQTFVVRTKVSLPEDNQVGML